MPEQGHGDFVSTVRAMKSPRILELGTRRSNPGRSTMRKHLFPNASEHLGTDIQPGLDVDIVADVHRLSSTVGEKCFDVVVSFSTFEHIKYPILAAHEIMKVLRVGGHLFIQTHQTFPIHSYPYDYYRFTREALASLFPSDMNFKVHETSYHFPARIESEADPWKPTHQAFLNVHLWGEKVGETPSEFLWELEDLVPI